jgi:hypothetical protein
MGLSTSSAVVSTDSVATWHCSVDDIWKAWRTYLYPRVSHVSAP